MSSQTAIKAAASDFYKTTGFYVKVNKPNSIASSQPFVNSENVFKLLNSSLENSLFVKKLNRAPKRDQIKKNVAYDQKTKYHINNQ